MYAIKAKDEISPEYLRSILMSQHFLAYTEKESGRASIPKINRKALLAYRIPKPSKSDVAITTTKIRKIDHAIGTVTHKLELLEELHQSIATRAFAGKL